ncbi:23S rRNA (adenine(2503)-C(2))-methyltransferase RlmN [Sulfurihydrogenibium sp.]|uniref:23S rRNA (adenine(2503)-C(2))-methyltransferase RlmN n=1 Tax=Sulfurihydrogenibium sp. TaxID=2053621 RepID=UPI002629C211|nr:23S rRNA (adenine(2503)-C(2))-methyltransferase RlmN [Sulfurihydrogenibium sp.]
MINLKNLNYKELEKFVLEKGWQKFRAKQIAKWLYNKKVKSFQEMTDLSKDIRQTLEKECEINSLQLITYQQSKIDGSIKFLWKLKDGNTIETVLINEKNHKTLCVSTQVGCAVGCRFCYTTKDGLIRNLETSEIVDQYINVQRFLGESEENRISNIVYMGMGEPLANYENVKKSVQIFTHPDMCKLSHRKITISSSGILHQIRKMYEDKDFPEVKLAVSLNASNQNQRAYLMPISQTNTLEELMELLRSIPLKPGWRITLEYVLIKNVNDTPEDAKRLVNLLKKDKHRFKVNLIPFNPYPESDFERPEENRVLAFEKILWDNNIATFIRWSKGRDIAAACGQLRKKELLQIDV